MLYKIKYAETRNGVRAAYQRSLKDHQVDEWLKANCEKPYYHSPGYLTEKFIEFESEYEASMFALRWA